MRRILITGGAGNIGGSLARRLVENPNNFVTIIDNLITGNVNKLPDKKYNNWFFTSSDENINYEELQLRLLEQNFEDADRLTSSYLRKLAGKLAENRGYVFYSEVNNMSGIDLQTIDRLWTIYSNGRFGFSIQAKLLKSVGKKYELLWPKIGWKKDGYWTRYPSSFSWSLEAPEGHMPLINQLRGVRLMDSILRHPAISLRHNNIL